MRVELSPEQEMFRDSSRKFLDAEYPTSAVRALSDGSSCWDPEMWRRGADLGWTAVLIPEALGGVGQDVATAAVVAGELGRAVHPGPFIAGSVVAWAVARFGSDQQRERVLPGLAAGELAATWACAEPGPGDDPAAPGSTLTAHDGRFSLSGAKSFVQDAPHAEWLLVTASLGGEPVEVLVRSDADGVTCRRQSTLDITRGFWAVEFGHVPVEADAVVVGPKASGAAVEGSEPIHQQLQLAALLTCADAVGAAERLLEMTVEYAKEREQFGRPIGSFQAIKHKCADMAIALAGSRVATDSAARSWDDPSRMDKAVDVAKSYVGERLSALASEALQTHGGVGFTWEHDLHLYLRRIKTDEMLYGNPASHRERLCVNAGLGDQMEA